MRSKILHQGGGNQPHHQIVTIEEVSLPNIAVLAGSMKEFSEQVRQHAIVGDYGRYHFIQKEEDVAGTIFTNYILAAGWTNIKDHDKLVHFVKQWLIDDHDESIPLPGQSKYEYNLPPKLV